FRETGTHILNTRALTPPKSNITNLYQWCIIAIGSFVFVVAASRLPVERIDFQFLLIAALTVIVSSRIAVKIPRFNTNVTISDTFIFLALLVYGGEAAILLAFADGLICGARAGRKIRTILFGAAVMSSSTLVTVLILDLLFGSAPHLAHESFPTLTVAICSMALAQYFVNTGLVAIGMSLKHSESFWQMWSKNFLWSSVTYFAGAVVAGFIASRVGMVGLYVGLVAMPMVFILYFTYYKYLEDIRSTA